MPFLVVSLFCSGFMLGLGVASKVEERKNWFWFFKMALATLAIAVIQLLFFYKVITL